MARSSSGGGRRFSAATEPERFDEKAIAAMEREILGPREHELQCFAVAAIEGTTGRRIENMRNALRVLYVLADASFGVERIVEDASMITPEHVPAWTIVPSDDDRLGRLSPKRREWVRPALEAHEQHADGQP